MFKKLRPRHFALLPVLAALAAGLVLAARPKPGEVPGIDRVVAGNNAFAFDLYRQLRSEKGNLFLSPHSISTALAMVWGGAGGETKDEMARVLHYQLPDPKLHAATAGLVRSLEEAQGQGKIELRIANALWGQTGHPFLKTFTDLNRTHYDAGLKNVDFKSAPDAARSEINGWVEKKTRNRIRDLLSAESIDPMTRLVLTNAIYFKGDWANAFKPEATVEMPFNAGVDSSPRVPMMRQTREFPFAETKALQILELPYRGDRLSMLILLPRQIDGLSRLEGEIDSDNVSAWVGMLRPRKVRVYLPRFRMESAFSLKEVLSSLGMASAFSAKADFSGVDGSRWLHISAVLHKAFVEVNEEGTEAAAATAVVLKKKNGGGSRVPVFRADHPFFFLIRDRETGSVLFLGRLANPEPAG